MNVPQEAIIVTHKPYVPILQAHLHALVKLVLPATVYLVAVSVWAFLTSFKVL